MTKEEERKKIEEIVSRYYDFSHIDEEKDSLTFTVDRLSSYPERFFSRLVDDLSEYGYVCFTESGFEDKIVVLNNVEKRNNRYHLRLLIMIATIASVIYVGYSYQSSYTGNTSFIVNLYQSILFFTIPIVAIFSAREIARFIALSINGMKYTFPIFVPDPIGMGTMGLINTPTSAFKSRKSLIQTGSFSLIAGFVVSIIIVLIGNLIAPLQSTVIPAINSPVEKLSSPLIFQVLLNKFFPSKGILDPMAFAGWIGIIITSFNALPVGFLDGGLISSALMGDKSIYLSYVSIIAIILLGMTYLPWILLAVFAVLVGVRGPQPLNNVSRISSRTKILAFVSFAILLLGVVPFPYHIVNNQIVGHVDNPQVLIVNGSRENASFPIIIKNEGVSSIVPAFSVSPAAQFTVSGTGQPIDPGKNSSYKITLSTWNLNKTGLYSYKITSYSGETSETFSVSVLVVSETPDLIFNSSNPFSITSYVGNSFTINLRNAGGTNATLQVASFTPMDFNYELYLYQSGTGNVTKSMVGPSTFFGGNITLRPGQSLPITMVAHGPISKWTIVAYDNNYTAAIAYISVLPNSHK